MPAPKTKTASNGNAPKGKAPSTSGTSTPASTFTEKDTPDHLAVFAGGKPDKKLHDVEQSRIKGEIDILQGKLSTLRDKIALATKSGPGNDRRNALRAELDGIREQQSMNKSSRAKQSDQIKAIQENIQKKIKDLQTAKSRVAFKSVVELDAHIKNLEKQVDSGNMKLADEKRALQDISSSKKSRRIVEGFQADQENIEADRQKIKELQKELDDPVSKAVSERYDAIRAELDELKKESDAAYAGRSKLFEERDKIQSQLDALFDEKRESVQRFREAGDRYWQKVNEDRARRAEKARAQRAAEEAQRKKDIAERLLEEAQVPAFQAQIEDCQTLIDFFSGKNTANVTYKSPLLTTKTEVAGVPKLELRQVETEPEGVIIRKKKGEGDDDYFVGGKNKNKGKKGPKANGSAQEGGPTPTSPTPANSSLNVPLSTLSALLSLSIPPPAAANSDVSRVIEDLKTKKAWFEANQTHVTTENIAKATAEIERLTMGDATSECNPVNESPAEPASTPQSGVTAAAVSSNIVVDKLEVVQEDMAARESP